MAKAAPFTLLSQPSFSIASTPVPLEMKDSVVGTVEKGLGNELVVDGGSETGPSGPPTPTGKGLPPNFGNVVEGVYRSSFPQPDNLDSIRQLDLKTIITLVNEEWSPEYQKFVEAHGIKSHIIPILANKDPGVFTPENTILNVLRLILNPTNHPLLIHCNKGKHRTGCVVGCFRKLQGWSLPAAIAEYVRFSEPKSRALDRNYIQNFDGTSISWLVNAVGAQNWAPTILPANVCSDGGEGENDRDTPVPIPKAESAPPATFPPTYEKLHRFETG